MKRAKFLVAVWVVVLPALIFPSLIFAQDADGDGVSDRNDNCVSAANPLQADLEWSTQSGTLVLYDDDLAIHSWATPPLETGSTVHDGDTALKIIGNNLITEIAPNLGQSGPQRYLRFWIYLTSGTADLALQINCGDGSGWNHKWGFSGNGTWEGEAWSFNGQDLNMPVGQWLPIMLDIQGALSCDNLAPIYGIGWDVLGGNVAYVDSAAFYSTSPEGDVCDFTNDFDADGLTDGEELTVSNTDPADPDSDDDGLSDGDEVNTWGTNPNSADSDADGLDDWEEIYTYSTNPNDWDSDNDNISDGAEVNIFGTDPNIPDPDSDADGLPDVVETDTGVYVDITNTGTDPNDPDTDDDGVLDGEEVLAGSNPLDQEIIPGIYSKTGSDILVGSSVGSEIDISWGGSEFVIVWQDFNSYDIFLSRLTGLGDIVTISKQVTYSESYLPQLAWSGSEFGLSYSSYGATPIATFIRLEQDGSTIGPSLSPAGDTVQSFSNSLIWTGSEYGMSWYQRADVGDYRIALTRIDPSGEMIIPAKQLTAINSLGYFTNVASSGSEYAVAWDDWSRHPNQVIYLARADLNGDTLGAEKQLTYNDDINWDPKMAWTGSEYGMTWYQGNWILGNDYFIRLSASGDTLGQAELISDEFINATNSDLIWAGNIFAASQIATTEEGTDVYLALLRPDGTPLIRPLRVNDYVPINAGRTALVWTGSSIGVAWTLNQWPSSVYLSIVGIDHDGDGLSDDHEIYYSLTDPNYWDTDNDQVSDGAEVRVFGTDPFITDTDGDGLSDGLEINVIQTNPLADADADGDGLTDAEEVLFFGTDPNDADMDDDGLSDYDEIMTYFTDPWYIDTDNDGLSDWSEVYVTLTSPVLADTDSDGVPDGQETGSTLTDNDNDNMPGTWEKLYACVNSMVGDSTGDPDSDGRTNIAEYSAGTDPCNPDTDQDGLCDGSIAVGSTCAAGEITRNTSPINPDTDGDGLPDNVETNTGLYVSPDDTGADPNDADSDDDGFSDGAEVAAGADPNDPNSIPAQPSRLINYQGRLMDNAGVAMGGTVTMRFQIFTSLSGSTVVWGETQDVHVVQGIYNVLLGNVNPLDPDAFAAAGKNVFFLQVSVNGEPMSLRQRIASVPQAIFADRLMNGRIETDGRTLMVSAPAASVTMRVSFNQAFAAPPRVWVSALNAPIGGRKFIDTIITNISATGFDVTFDSLDGQASSGSASFTYAAFGN